MDDIYISGAGQNLGEGRESRPTNPPPSPSVEAYQDPGAMSSYLRGPLSDWLSQNRSSYPDYQKIVDQITTASASLNAEKRTSEGAISEYNALMQTLGFPISDSQKLTQMAASAGGVAAKATKQAADVSQQVQQAQKELDNWQNTLNSLKGSLPENPSEKLQSSVAKADKMFSSAQSMVGALQAQVGPLQANAQQSAAGASEIQGLVNTAGQSPEREAMERVATRYRSFVQSQAKPLPDMSLQIQNSFASLRRVINEEVKPGLGATGAATATTTPVTASPSAGVPSAGAGPVPQGQGQNCYFELDQVPIWNLVNWQVTPPVINTEALNQYIDTIATNMKNNGQTNVAFNFAQLASIDALTSSTPWNSSFSANDSIGMMYKSIPGIQQNLLTPIVQRFQQDGLTTSLSFGGATAGDNDWSIGQGPNAQNPAYASAQADKLATWVQQMGFSGVDFDIESDDYSTVNPPDCVTSFFSELSTKLNHNPPMTLTVLGALANTQAGGMYATFFQPSSANFNNWFDGINLMCYNGQFYLDPTNPSWGIEGWINAIGKTNAAKLHIGFSDEGFGQPGGYCQANCPDDWSQYGIPDGTSSGTAAAMIYSYIIKKLENDGYISNANGIGQPFWWPSAQVDSYNNPSGFISQTMQDFYSYLKANVPTTPEVAAAAAPAAPSAAAALEAEEGENPKAPSEKENQ